MPLKVKPVKQKKKRKRKFTSQVIEAVRQEVGKLLSAGFIKEVAYLDWVSNIAMVKKANGKWRMCIDFTNLNKAFPKDTSSGSRRSLLAKTRKKN